MRVLVVEDNETYGRLLAARLGLSGFEADVAVSVAEAEWASSQVDYSAIVLDLGLPDRDGMEFLRELRGRGKTTPVLIVTARNRLADRVAALHAGADDFMGKPFSTDELIARLHAVLRRPHTMVGRVMRLGNLAIDLETRQVRVDGALLSIRLREQAILELLVRDHGTVVTRRAIEAHLFGLADESDSNAIDVYVHRLRRHLADSGATVQIHTVRGVGFMISVIRQPVHDADMPNGRNGTQP
ncbi:MAG: response regulator transcription factor [Alphaproteobacteria bacterium]|nr:response regulator transcription factor [Alphaproteobacteria bacterium]MBV8408603.1 response regulator transcription factor [Alphaproteobacteria bacterium]